VGSLIWMMFPITMLSQSKPEPSLAKSEEYEGSHRKEVPMLRKRILPSRRPESAAPPV
jgi:hypothetical protein